MSTLVTILLLLIVGLPTIISLRIVRDRRPRTDTGSKPAHEASRLPSYLKMDTADIRLGVVTLAATLGANVLTAVVFFAALAAYHHDEPFHPGTNAAVVVAIGIVLGILRVGQLLPERVTLDELATWVRSRPSWLKLILDLPLLVYRQILRVLYFAAIAVMLILGLITIGSLLGYAYAQTK